MKKKEKTKNAPLDILTEISDSKILTMAERKLVETIAGSRRDAILKYRIFPQFTINIDSYEYSIDFAIPDIKIAIEVDGEVFHSTKKQIASDTDRDEKLAKHGWTILRFNDTEIQKRTQQVIDTITKTITQKENKMKKEKTKKNRIGISIELTDEEKFIYDDLKTNFAINMSQLCKNLIFEYYYKTVKKPKE